MRSGHSNVTGKLKLHNDGVAWFKRLRSSYEFLLIVWKSVAPF